MEDEDWRNECVIQDDGYVYRGNRRRGQQKGKAWQFSQVNIKCMMFNILLKMIPHMVLCVFDLL